MELFLYGMLVTIFSVIGHWHTGRVPQAWLAAGIVGGGLISTLAIFAVRQYAIDKLCLVAVAGVLVGLFVLGVELWTAAARREPLTATPLIVTLLAFFGVGQFAALRK